MSMRMYCYTTYMKKGMFVLLLQFLFFGSATSVFGASLYMDPASTTLKRADTVVVSVRLDAGEDECVNVVDAVINYTENIQPVDISRGNSIFSLWVEAPVINKENRTITFAGGIPNGYCGRIPGDPRLTNNVVDLLFQSPGLQIGSTESGDEVSIDFGQETQILLNDGFGSVAPATFYGAKIHLTKDAGGTILNPWKDVVTLDTLPPERFSIELTRIPDALGNYYIVFNTTDKQSGIDHYEVIEEPLDSKNLFGWGAETAPWVKGVSPYLIEDQSLNSTIRVKALDKAGNEYIATLVPDEQKRTLSNENIIIIGVLSALGVLIVALSIIGVVAYRKRRKNLENENEVKLEENE